MATSDPNRGPRVDDEIEPQPLAHHTTTTSEKADLEKETTGGSGRQGQYAHIDENLARKVAANVDDFMV